MLNESVVIPSSYFLKMAIIDYSNWQIALVREFLQNSIDAGSTVIDMTFSEEKFTVIDNGCGMNEDIIRNSLLTLGGSAKSENSIGGLGKAKEILYFSWPTWEIHSHDILVKGSGSQFSLQNNAPFLDGTCSVITLPKDIVTEREIENAVKALCVRSLLKVTVTYNGMTMNDNNGVELGTPVGDIKDLGKLYVNVGTSLYCEVVIQSRGLYMFSRHTSSKFSYIFNIEVPSYDSLTSNRDGFIRQYRDQFDQLITRLTLNPSNMDYIQKIVIPIVDREKSIMMDDKYRMAICNNRGIPKELMNNNSLYEFSWVTKKLVGFEFTTEPKVIQLRGTRIKEFYIQYSRMFSRGFMVLTDKVETELFLNLLNPEMIALSKLWQKIVNTVFSLQNPGSNYYPDGTGFVLIKDSAAYNYNHWICINPLHLITKSIEEIIASMYISAVHELIHNEARDHDQDFIGKEEDLMIKVLKTKIDVSGEKTFFNKFFKKAKNLSYE